MILLDTGPIVAFFDASDDYHKVCIEILKSVNEPLITTWPVLTEAFYLLGFSWKAQDNLWEFIVRGGVEVFSLDDKQQSRCRKLMEKSDEPGPVDSKNRTRRATDAAVGDIQ